MGPDHDQPTTGIAAQLALSLKALQDGLNAIQQQFNAMTKNEQPTTNQTGPRAATDNGHSNSGIEQPSRSGNIDFFTLCKTTFRYVQICHHMENWHNFLENIGKSINPLITNKKPPMPN